MWNPIRMVLIIGDLIVFLLVTLVGFASHNELTTAGLRMLTTFLPLLAGWMMVVPIFSLYPPTWSLNWRQLWHPLYAGFLAGILASVIRGFWLSRPIIPIFILVMCGASVLGIGLWRSLVIVWYRRNNPDGRNAVHR